MNNSWKSNREHLEREREREGEREKGGGGVNEWFKNLKTIFVNYNQLFIVRDNENVLNK